jgi:hypothetical protein
LATHRIINNIENMRTKALLLTAAASLIGAAAMAQAVVSVNVVGFVNVTIPASGYAMVANQLNGSPNNVITNVIPTAPGGTQVFTWDAVNQQLNNAIEFVPGVGWVEGEAISEAVLAPGMGFYVLNNQATPLTLTFVGEVSQGTAATGNALTVNMVAAGYSMISSIVPQSLGLTAMGFPTPTQPGVQYYSFNTVSQSLNDAIEYVPTVGWVQGESIVDPTPAVGEGFFILNPNATGMTWTRDFKVN